MAPRAAPIGVILAGGAGSRLGGAKATVHLQGKPLIAHPFEAVREALGEAVVIAKADTPLPSLAGATVWIEPATPRHPLVGIMHALSLAEGRAVLVCAADLPLVTPALIARIAAADPGGAPAVVARSSGHVQPLLGCYQAEALGPLRSIGHETSMRDVVAAIGARTLEVADVDLLFNVNTPDDLLQAAAMLDRRRRISRT